MTTRAEHEAKMTDFRESLAEVRNNVAGSQSIAEKATAYADELFAELDRHVIQDFDIQAASGDGPVGLTFDVELLKKRVVLDAAIVEAAERQADLVSAIYEEHADYDALEEWHGACHATEKAVRAKREALKP